MAAALHTFFSTFLFFFSLTAVSASPALLTRSSAIIVNSTGTIQVFDPTTDLPISQSIASDGSGSDLSLTAIIWIAFCFLVGVPLALAGLRGWRLTTGAGIGLAAAVCAWASLISTVSTVGLSDILITVVVLSFFVLGFILGVFEVGRLAGVTLLGITSGLAVGIRVILLKQQLLLAGETLFFVNWLIIAFFGLLNGMVMIWKQRVGITVSAASTGTFLSSLALDLVINKQAGMSRGLRFLFDRNTSHLTDILQNGYIPHLSTQIILALSLAFVPILAYAQHRVFPRPFTRRPAPKPDLTSLNLDPDDKRDAVLRASVEKTDTVTEPKSGWDETFKASSRFSM